MRLTILCAKELRRSGALGRITPDSDVRPVASLWAARLFLPVLEVRLPSGPGGVNRQAPRFAASALGQAVSSPAAAGRTTLPLRPVDPARSGRRSGFALTCSAQPKCEGRISG